jgi:hypothetical protein
MGGAMGVFKQPAEFASNKKHFCGRPFREAVRMSWFGKSKEPNAKSPETLEHKRLVLLLSQAEKFKQGGDTFEPEYEWFFAPLPTSAEGQALPLADYVPGCLRNLSG